MTDLEKIREFIGKYPGFPILEQFSVDFTDQVPSSGGIFPSGMLEVQRVEDILGNTVVTCQYNFALYYVFAKEGNQNAQVNADWIIDFQKWVQEQSIRGYAPRFGDHEKNEVILAQNGVLYDQNDQGTATYMVQLSVKFIKKYEEINEWQK